MLRFVARAASLLLLATVAARAAPDRIDVSKLSASEIRTQQEQLKAAGCYTGEADGKPGEALRKAIDACPDLRRSLRIETGMHVAIINRIGVDRSCRIAATASDDKTIRLWSLPDGKLLRTLRWPVGGGNLGKAFAVAVSPDGKYVAGGGWDTNYETIGTHSLSIFDASTGALIKRVGNFENVIIHLAYSQDGRYLAAALGSGAGVRMIDTVDGRIVAEDRNYGGASYGIAFGPDGRLFATAFDGKVRRYAAGPGFKREAEVEARGGKQPYSVAVDPSGERLAVGFADSVNVDYYDAPSLRYRGSADTKSVTNGEISSVQWRADGGALIAGGRYQLGTQTPFLLFDREGKPLPTPQALSESTIMDFLRCADGFAVSAGDPAFGLLTDSGGQRLWKTGAAPNMRTKLGNAFVVSGDGKKVRFGLGWADADPVLFDLQDVSLKENPSAPADLYASKIEGLPVKDWRNSESPRFAGKPITLEQYELSRSLAIKPDGKGFVMGAEFTLLRFDKSGKPVWKLPAPGMVWGVNIPKNNKIVVAAYGDGTIRWHELSGGKELLALFVHRETKQWVAWTPSGYYMASPGGEDLIGWHVNRGWDQAADFFPASRFRDVYYRPDIVQRVLDTLDEAKAVELANAARPAPAPAVNIAERLPPVVSILSPIEGTTVPGSETRVAYLVRSPSGLDVDALDVLIDGRPSGLASALARDHPVRRCLLDTKGQGRTSGALQGCRGEVTVALPPGEPTVSLVARAGERIGEPEAVRLKRAAPATVEESRRGRLFALVVGISQYAARDLRLQFADRDAELFARALEHQKGSGLYADVQVRALSNGAAHSRAIKEGLEWLFSNVGEKDTAMVFLSGHGMLDERGRFYFLGAGSDPSSLWGTAVSHDDIRYALRNIKGSAILFIDACHAGGVFGAKGDNVDLKKIASDFGDDRGIATFVASTGKQFSREDPDWKNGAFTKALVEGLGMQGQKSLAADRAGVPITTSRLDAYVTGRVKELTQKFSKPGEASQTPMLIRNVPDFELAVAR